MKKLFYLIFILLTVNIYSQDAPTSYTTHYRLGKWAAGSNPGADSLNAQWDKIDNAIWNVADSTRGIYNLFFMQHNSNGYIKPNSISYSMFDATVSNNYVTVNTSQSINGAKYFHSILSFSGKDGVFILPDESIGLNTNLSGMLTRYGSNVLFYKTATSIDTLSSINEVRTIVHDSLNAFNTSNFVNLNSAQTISGDKTFNGFLMQEKTNYVPILTSYNDAVNPGVLIVNGTFTVVNSITGTNTTITDISGYNADGNYLIILNTTATNLILADHTGNIRLNGSTDFTLGGDDIITLIYFSGNWYEVSGSHN